MEMFKRLLIGILLGVSAASPVLAAEEQACLQNNRIWGWQAVNDRTLIVTDRTYNRYTIDLSGGCINLSQYTGVNLLFRTKTALGCVTAGDRIAFNSPGIGPQTCFVNAVRAGTAPAPAADGK
jgi:hypothetical protein